MLIVKAAMLKVWADLWVAGNQHDGGAGRGVNPRPIGSLPFGIAPTPGGQRNEKAGRMIYPPCMLFLFARLVGAAIPALRER